MFDPTTVSMANKCRKKKSPFSARWFLSVKQLLDKSFLEPLTDNNIPFKQLTTGADPGFPVGRGANPPLRGRQHMILPNFPKNCMKLRIFWVMGRAPGTPLDPPLNYASLKPLLPGEPPAPHHHPSLTQ